MFKHYKKDTYKLNYDHYSYYAYRYHRIFFGSLIFRGRKIWAFNFFLNLKYELKKREQLDPLLVFIIALFKVTPNVLLCPLKVSGSVSGVPLPIHERKKFTFASKWIIKLLKDKNRKVTLNALSDILLSSIYDSGAAIEKKRSIHKVSTLNRHLIRRFK